MQQHKRLNRYVKQDFSKCLVNYVTNKQAKKDSKAMKDNTCLGTERQTWSFFLHWCKSVKQAMMYIGDPLYLFSHACRHCKLANVKNVNPGFILSLYTWLRKPCVVSNLFSIHHKVHLGLFSRADLIVSGQLVFTGQFIINRPTQYCVYYVH